ncbi:acyl-coenzyme A:6-aminopenicillanic acid acyl-transferase-domain-containing protein [Aspergillus stella-maris]|uniref:acyl-coenzyme A:6-aminopenicillanic acid acyl-transferase-domain-containing protein n=1 Tax=Aspergillus stella-maris TaxID=1810926 RepID=UPI003CCDB087
MGSLLSKPEPPAMLPHVPTITLSGDPYNIGLQHGQQAKTLIERNITTYTAFFAETAGLSWSEAKTRSEAFIPTLEKLYPAILEEIKGIADGTGLEVLDILALNVRSEIALTNFENKEPEKEVPAITDGCTSLAQLSADGTKLIVAQNWDWVADLSEGMLILDVNPTPSAGKAKRFFTMTEAGLVGKVGLNSSGLALCLNALRCGAFDAERLPTHIMTRYVLEHADGFDSAVAMIEKLGGASSANMMMGDAGGKSGTVEVTPMGISVLSPQTAGAQDEFDLKRGKGPSFVAHTNHVITPPKDFPRGAIYDRPAANSFSRLERVTELARDDAIKGTSVSVDSVYARLKDRKGDPTSICRGLPLDAKGMEKMTTLASVVVVFDVAQKTGRGFVTVGRPCEDNLQRIEWAFD